MTTMTVPMMTACYRWLAKYCRWAKARTCEMRCYRVQHMRTWWVCFFVNWGRVRAIGVHVLFEAHMRNGRYERRTVIKIKWKWKYLCCSDIFNDVDDGRTLAGPAAAPWQDSVALWCMHVNLGAGFGSDAFSPELCLHRFDFWHYISISMISFFASLICSIFLPFFSPLPYHLSCRL